MTLLAGDNLVVTMHYTLKDDEGKQIDSSEGQEPLAYLHGAGNIVPGLESVLTGKTVGDKVQVRVEPADGYGEYMAELVHQVPLDAFQGVEKVEVGMVFHAQLSDGQPREIEVKDIDGDQATIDANHPLAGVALNFDVEIVGIREATEEELDHGHVH